MEYAKDKQTGREINASEAIPGIRYICPVCGKNVYRPRDSSGRDISPHFKHNRGEGTTDCENYHPGTHHQEIALTISNPTTYFSPVRPTQSLSPQKVNVTDYSFNLNIQLFNPTSTTLTLAWQLTVTFIPHPDQNDYLLVKQGISGQAKVPLSQFVAIPVKIQELDYQLEIDNHLETKPISKPLQGLSSHLGNVFKHQGDHGNRLESSKSLYWGEQYFIIWHEKLGMNFSPKIKRRELTTQQNWKGVEILLPNSPDNAIIDWAKRYLERTIEIPRFMLSLVNPFLDRSDIIPKIQDTDEVVIAIIDSLGNLISDTLVIEHKTSKLQRINFAATSPVIIDLGCLALGETTIRLENVQNGWLIVNCVPRNEQIFPQAVRLKFQNYGVVFVYHGMNRKLQDDSLTGVEFPTPMKFNILTKRQSELEWQVTPITTHPEESLKDFENLVLQAILEQLNNQDLFVRLDFGNFGQLLIQQPVPVDKSDLALPRQVTRQLNWLTGLAQSGHPVSGEGLRMFKHLSRHHGELNHYFQHTQGIPATVEPHLRILAKRITKIVS